MKFHSGMGFKARGQRRRVRSDWMAAPRERGISVSSAVMSFEHEELAFNLLDTPGHQRFQPKRIFGDTYRTLTPVPPWRQGGIEEQTRKFFEVCRLRDVPIITFINKLDREGRDPFDLLDEIEQSLALDVTPASWPIVPKTRASIEAVAAGPQVKNYVARTACPSICWRPEPYGAWRSFEMKHVALAVMVALATLVLSQTSRAAVCANGVYRAGCVGPNGAAVVHKAPRYGPHRSVSCANGVYRAGCVGPQGAAVVRKPY